MSVQVQGERRCSAAAMFTYVPPEVRRSMAEDYILLSSV